jgi:hypothetical protein
VARQTVADLADQLTTLLSDLDAALRTRLGMPESRESRRRLHTTAEDDKGFHGVIVAALRWLTRSAEPPPPFPLVRSPRERSQGRE